MCLYIICLFVLLFVLDRPQTLLSGMNKFLESLEITFRRDPTNFRPRVNKMESLKVHYLCVISVVVDNES